MRLLDKIALRIGKGKVFQAALTVGVYALGAGAYLFIGIPVKKLQHVWRKVRKASRKKKRYHR